MSQIILKPQFVRKINDPVLARASTAMDYSKGVGGGTDRATKFGGNPYLN